MPDLAESPLPAPPGRSREPNPVRHYPLGPCDVSTVFPAHAPCKRRGLLATIPHHMTRTEGDHFFCARWLWRHRQLLFRSHAT